MYEIKEWLREKITDFALWLLSKAQPYKDEGLSWRLHDIADQYARTPTGKWNVGEQ